MDMGIDQAGKDGTAVEVQGPRAGRRVPDRGGRLNLHDPAVTHHDRPVGTKHTRPGVEVLAPPEHQCRIERRARCPLKRQSERESTRRCDQHSDLHHRSSPLL